MILHRDTGRSFSAMAAVRAVEQRDMVCSTFFGRLSLSTAKPWFIEVISTLPVVMSLTGWLAPVMALVHLHGLARRPRCEHLVAEAIPKVGVPESISFLITGTAYCPVAAGSPGAVGEKHPVRIERGDVLRRGLGRHHVTLQPTLASSRRMLRLMP